MSPPIADSTAIRPDAWLAETLGFPVFAVDPGARVEPAGGRALWYAKVDVADTEAVAALEEQGFRVVDVNVTLRRDEDRVAAGGTGVEAGPATPDEHERLIEIAGRSFRFSRFHLDPGTPDELADRVKREWIRNYAAGRRGIELLAAREGGEPIGFLAVLESGGARVIDLVGVDPGHQRRGAGDALVAAFVDRHAEAADELLVGTQAANRPSLRLYDRHGFTFARASYVLHRHEDPR